MSVLSPYNVKIKFLISAAHTCDNLEAHIADSVIVSGYIDPAVEGITVTFHCSPRLVLKGPNSATCMENGEWKPALDEIKCSGIHRNAIMHGCLYMT